MSKEVTNKPAKSNVFFAVMGAVMVLGLTFMVLTRTDHKALPKEEVNPTDSTQSE